MKHPLIILSILILSSPVIGDNHKGETLYAWGDYPKIVWKGFGDKETHSVYKGDVKNGVPNGLGILITPNGTRYFRNWKDGKKHGQGTQNFSSGSIYEGEWKNGKPDGQGTYTRSDGRKYVGGWKNGFSNGQGTETLSNGWKY